MPAMGLSVKPTKLRVETLKAPNRALLGVA